MMGHAALSPMHIYHISHTRRESTSEPKRLQ